MRPRSSDPPQLRDGPTRWRDSRFELLRSAYAALHQLVFAAWYANPRAWFATGYAGPPSLEIG